MSLARPVIVPRLPTLAELVVEDDNGLLFAPDDLSSLEEALGRANRMSAEAWRRMAGRAFATANRYDWRVIGHSLSGLLYRLIAKPRVRHAVGDRVVAD
jgi:glycosyltransferase involved in cell wall biosynthesis